MWDVNNAFPNILLKNLTVQRQQIKSVTQSVFKDNSADVHLASQALECAA